MSEVTGTRRARLYVTRIDPWSVTKAAFMLALSLSIVLIVAVTVVWMTLNAIGVLNTLTTSVDDVIGSSVGGFSLVSALDFGRVLGATMVLSSVQIVLISALAAVFAFLYNLSVGITGGIEVVLSDE
ncbi:MAG: DUF3566 domain-containing protein [Actinobacteria bacterium]|nr:DUF3566 domain-containing protein [Actinomycetota bacterium]